MFTGTCTILLYLTEADGRILDPPNNQVGLANSTVKMECSTDKEVRGGVWFKQRQDAPVERIHSGRDDRITVSSFSRIGAGQYSPLEC